jgi:hypothetical protein
VTRIEAYTERMAVTTAPARAKRARSKQLARPLAQPGTTRKGRRDRQENAAATRDVFMDIIVVLSVLMFIALASGVGVLAIQASNPAWLAR